MPATHLSCYK